MLTGLRFSLFVPLLVFALDLYEMPRILAVDAMVGILDVDRHEDVSIALNLDYHIVVRRHR